MRSHLLEQARAIILEQRLRLFKNAEQFTGSRRIHSQTFDAGDQSLLAADALAAQRDISFKPDQIPPVSETIDENSHLAGAKLVAQACFAIEREFADQLVVGRDIFHRLSMV